LLECVEGYVAYTRLMLDKLEGQVKQLKKWYPLILSELPQIRVLPLNRVNTPLSHKNGYLPP
jgi:hypothetical protein